MRTTLTAVDVSSARRVDVLVELDAGDRVAALETALAGLLSPAAEGLWLGERRLDPDTSVAEAGVRSGCLLLLGGPAPVSPGPALAEVHVVSGPDAGLVHPLVSGDTVVGRSGDLRLTDPDVARRHLQLHAGPAGVVATDLGAGSRLGGRDLSAPSPVGAADLIEVGSSVLVVVPGDRRSAAVTPGPELTQSLNRAPRIRPAATVRTIELPAPPVPHEPRKLGLLPLVLPVLLGVVLAVLSGPLFLLLTLMSPLLALGSWWSERRAGRSAGAKAQAAYVAALTAAEAETADLVRAETAARRSACPDAAAVLRTATGPGPRVWERRRADEDGLLLRVGSGPADATTVRLTGAAAADPVLQDVPITVPLRKVGVLGVAGPVDLTRSVARWLVGQAAVLHSPRDLSIQLLVDPAVPTSEQDWAWLRWLPHAQAHDGAALVGLTDSGVAARIAELGSLVIARQSADRRSERLPPDVLVVLDGARALRALPGMAAVLRDGPALGVLTVCLDEQDGLLPQECQAVVTCQGSRLTVRQAGEPDRADVRAELVSPAWAEQVARGLAPLRDVGTEPGEGQLPDSARLLDVLGLPVPSADAVRTRMGRTTQAIVGVGADGPFTVDLSRDGPHALVAGTTGAGKSELLQTLVASLAVANRPDAMTFVLVDYKGGAAFKDCARLPHTVGMVTDLDGHLVERALASLTAELKIREQLLAAAGAKDLEDYWRTGAVLPRLVIVIDEFASLVEELPDFVRGLVGIAQRGRSLGLHLVLATQRPSGVVSPEIRANTNLRIALRVTDAAESLDVVDAPDAGSIARRHPGRAYARTGHASLTAFQTARVGGRTPGAASETAAVHAVPLPWSRVGDPLPEPRPQHEPDEEQTDLHTLVSAIQEAVAALDLPPPRRPWLEPLPEAVTLAEVRRLLPPEGLRVAYGLEDVPAEQARRAAWLDLELGGHLLVAGAPRSGRSTLLRTLGTSLAASVAPSDAHLYALDCGNGALLPLADLPHCGAVVTRGEPERADRLLNRLTAEIVRRHELLTARGFGGLSEQRAASADPLPYLVVLLDSWEGFTAAFQDLDAGRMIDVFLRLLREGPGVGLRVVVTGDRGVLVGKLAGAVEDVLCLRLADRSDYTLAGLSPRTLPREVGAGRGFRSGSEVQVALLVADESGTAQAAAVADLAEHWRGRRTGGRAPFRVEALPTVVSDLDALARWEPAPLRTVIGVGGDELAHQVVDLASDGPGFTIAGPPRSGRSTALLAAADGLLAGGTSLCVLLPRPSPLRRLAGQQGVLLVGTGADPAELASVLNAATGPLAVLVDDAELLHDAAVADLLQQVLRDGRDRGHVMVLAGTTSDLAASFRGFTADARRSRTGLLLSPASHLEGELLGVRLARSAAFSGPPGRGLLVRGGHVQLVQVPATTPPP